MSGAAALALTSTLSLAQTAGQGRPLTTDEPARQLDLTVSAGVTHSDNLGRESADEESGLIGIAGLDLQFAQKSRRVDTDIDLNAAYQHFLDGDFDDDVIGGVDASLKFGVVPDRFVWEFTENFGQLNLNPFEAPSPENRENVNIFGTSPMVFFKLGDAVDMRVGATYTKTDYEIRNLDGTATEGEIELRHSLSGKSSISLIASAGTHEFDDDVVNPQYDLGEALVNYTAAGSRTSISADLGYNAVRFDDTSGGALVRLSISREVSAGTELTLGGGREFSNAGDVFRLGQGAGGVQLQTMNVIGTADPFERTYANLGYHFHRNRTSLGVDLQTSQERHEAQIGFDRDVTRYSLYIGRQLSPTLSVRVDAAREREDFDITAFDDEETRLGANLDWQVGRRLSLRLRYDHFDRESNTPTSEYTENQASLYVLWSPLRKQ